jgi:hypothetical protein
LVEETGVPEETFIYCRDDFSNYIVFNWFRLFSLEYFPMKVGPFEKEVEDGFSYFSLIFSYIIFQIESSLILFCFCQWLATDGWFSLGSPVSPTNKTDHHYITEILLKVALNTIRQTTLSSLV